MNEDVKKWILLIVTLLIVCISLTVVLCKYFYYSGMVKVCENSDAYLITGLKCMDKELYELEQLEQDTHLNYEIIGGIP